MFILTPAWRVHNSIPIFLVRILCYGRKMKQCRYCQNNYPESEFGVALTTKNKVYYRHKCKSCYRETKRVLYNKHRFWLVNYKKNHKCARCNNADVRVLEFHHPNRKEKKFGIAVAFYNHLGLERIKKEAEKCVILCANCHRILHSEERATSKNGV